MLKQFRPAIVLLLLLTLITGVIYPLVVTGIAQVFFPTPGQWQPDRQNGKPVGSELIGQQFDDPKYFWGRSRTPATFRTMPSTPQT